MDLLEGSRGTRGLQNTLGEPLFKWVEGVSVVNLKKKKKKRLVTFKIKKQVLTQTIEKR